MAMLRHNQGRTDDAIAVMNRVLTREPNNIQALNFIGYTYAEQGIKLDEAERLIKKALEIKPDAGFIMDSMGWVYYQRGKYKDALEWLRKAIALEGEDPEILEHVGDCHLALKEKDKAVENYKKALKTTTSLRVRKRIEKKLEEIK
jgi:Tfp pilus assembly protein PilF